MFFCKHHCDAGQHDVGGISFKTIYEETDKTLLKIGQPLIWNSDIFIMPRNHEFVRVLFNCVNKLNRQPIQLCGSSP